MATGFKGKRGAGFQSGKSGNPGGRPKGYAEFRANLRENTPKAAEQLVLQAQQGKEWAVTLLLAYAWGKPPQPETGEGGEGPIQIVIRRMTVPE